MIFIFSLLSLLFAYEYNIMDSQKGKEILSLKNGDSLTIHFNKPYGTLIIHEWKDCLFKYDVRCIKDGTNLKNEIMYSDDLHSKIVGLYLHETIGTITFLSFNLTTISFSWITFPQECNLKYIQSVNNGEIKLKQSNIGDASTFCFYSFASAPLQYKIRYNISQQQFIKFIQSDYIDSFTINQSGMLDQTYNESSIITISDKIYEAINFLEITATSLSDESISQVNYNDFISYDNITLIEINIPKDRPNDKMKTTIFSILGAVIVFLIIVFSFIGFRRRNNKSIHESPETDSSSEIVSRPPTPEHIQIEQFQSDSADGFDQYSIHNLNDEFALDTEGYPQNDYNPSNVEYEVPQPVLLKTVLNEANAKI